MSTRTFIAAVAVLALAACGGDKAPATDEAVPATTDTAAPAAAPATPVAPEFPGVDTAQMQRTASGMYMKDVKPGEGPALVAGQTAVVHYTGWFTDGTKFDSSHDRGAPFPVESVGSAPVIPGWNEGLQGMKAGGERVLVIPSALAYGVGGMPPVIPPNATLVFLVQLQEIK
ncbi:MAG: FKBP-type peptidyl-prolyl cis-trans isomerase [Gemmatimonadetes bacterium]|nr:FKBP-type peptidyl-prolyl cis-trans isomerase [Gemmatimonadota bacterium]